MGNGIDYGSGMGNGDYSDDSIVHEVYANGGGMGNWNWNWNWN